MWGYLIEFCTLLPEHPSRNPWIFPELGVFHIPFPLCWNGVVFDVGEGTRWGYVGCGGVRLE